MDYNDLTPAFWAALWKQQAKQSRLKQTQELKAEVWRDFYDQTAPCWEYMSGDRLRLGEAVRAALAENDVCPRGASLLDLGCGTGAVSIPLARAGIDVCAVDNSGRMLAVLKKNAAASGIDSIRSINTSWTELDASEGFDCVLAAFFPPAFSPDGFSRMEELTEHYCCIVFPTGSDPFPLRSRLWRALLHEAPPERDFLLPCAFNYLETAGRSPNLIRRSWTTDLDGSYEDLLQFYTAYFSIFGRSGLDAETEIAGILSEYESGGSIRCSGTERIAVLWWAV